MIETIGWFFFDLFILGYVEDPLTGWSFRFPGGMQFAIYVEVGWISEVQYRTLGGPLGYYSVYVQRVYVRMLWYIYSFCIIRGTPLCFM